MPDKEYELTVYFMTGPLAGYEAIMESVDDYPVGSIQVVGDTTFKVLKKAEIDLDN